MSDEWGVRGEGWGPVVDIVSKTSCQIDHLSRAQSSTPQPKHKPTLSTTIINGMVSWGEGGGGHEWGSRDGKRQQPELHQHVNYGNFSRSCECSMTDFIMRSIA
jgi:hypothetical protein